MTERRLGQEFEEEPAENALVILGELRKAEVRILELEAQVAAIPSPPAPRPPIGFEASLWPSRISAWQAAAISPNCHSPSSCFSLLIENPHECRNLWLLRRGLRKRPPFADKLLNASCCRPAQRSSTWWTSS